jgi:hypothetical protein
VIRKVTIGVAVYAAICVAVLSGLPFVVRIVESLSSFAAIVLALCALTLVGPATVFTEGPGALPWFVAILLVIAACVWLSKVLWRRYPDSEVFVIFVVPAVLLWIGPGLMLVLDHLT